MSNFTKEAIKQSFIKLLEARPLKQITVRDIVEDCGINRNSFYYHFPDVPTLLEEIIIQKRIELWGEFGRTFDIRRLKQGFQRTAAQGWPSGLLLPKRPTANPENYMWVVTIPQAEFDGNTNMDISKDQNPAGDE
jgi:AcrR family transcriptional regulator